jgi:hypothetical protein
VSAPGPDARPLQLRYDPTMITAHASDTSPDASRVQVELLRRAGETRRFALCRSLTETVVALSRRALREQLPDATEQEVLLRWVALQYGEALAQGVRRRLARSR